LVLLHGAGADASQWVDIGMDRAVDVVAANHPTPFVAVAPDLQAGDVAPLVLDALLPAIEARFGTHGAFAVSGISRGAGQALATAVAAPGRFGSIGLHSPAGAVAPRGRLAPVLIDAGADDPLQPAARRLAADLTRAGIAVTAMWPPGSHDRRYWRAHLERYLEFHVTTHETTT
jgi:enterochelin esterase-like enzyme